MPPKGWKKNPNQTYTKDASPEEFLDMLLSVPTSAFDRMAASCGLPHLEARKLALAFKALKGE